MTGALTLMSPRPRKIRRCSGQFRGRAFKPTGTPLDALTQVPLYRDELETLKLCDGMGLTQQEAGLKMGISRGTVQRIITGARKKIAVALNEGQALVFVDQDV